MEHHTSHTMHHQHTESNLSTNTNSNFLLALSATLHCLLGCGICEVLGMIMGTAFNLEMTDTTIISIIMGIIAGLALGVVPLVKAKFTFNNALKTVIIGEGLSIAVMETFEVVTQWLIPGVMEAQLSEMIFWVGMLAALIAGFFAALPVNYFMIRRGIRHQH